MFAYGAHLLPVTNVTNTVGFGTAALGSQCHNVILMALDVGFRYFDTAEENEYWYNSAAVGSALREFHHQLISFSSISDTTTTTTTTTTTASATAAAARKASVDPPIRDNSDVDDIIIDDECVMIMNDDDDDDVDVDTTTYDGLPTCSNHHRRRTLSLSPQERFCYEIRVSTKIPPWELINSDHIRNNAKRSRHELMSFCDVDNKESNDNNNNNTSLPKMPLDIYYIHAPACWKGWHTKCDNPPDHLLDLRSVWLAMEAVVGIDHSARRIGLSNIRTDELLDIIHFVQERQKIYNNNNNKDPTTAPPRMPDVVQSYADPIEPATEIRHICAQYQIEFVSYSTLGTQHIYRGNNPSRTNPVLTHPTVIRLAEHYQRSTAEIVLSWAIQQNMSIIPRSSQKIHIEQLSRLLPQSSNNLPMGFLSNEDLAQIDLMKG